MTLSPTGLDFWIARELAGFLRHSQQFDMGVQSAIKHNILGGLWFGAALFISWIQSARRGQSKTQVRILTILVGTTFAVLLTLIAEAVISWPPPARYPGLANLFPDYMDFNDVTNCFPSQSTALYGCVAAGIYSLHKAFGRVLWVLVAFFVALPRMYVGGHFFTDIVAGLLLGLFSYHIVRRFLEAGLIVKVWTFLEARPRLGFLMEFFIFLWIVQVTIEFRDAVWLEKVALSLVK